MALLQTLRSFVNERLCAAADEIFVVVERIITEYEDEAFSSKQQQLQQRILDVVLKHPDVGFRVADVSPEQQERSPCLIQEEEPESSSPVKEEQEELLLIPEEADGSTMTLAAVKHEDDYDDNDDDNSETEALASTSTEHMKTHTDAEDRGSSQSICGVQLLSSHWSESRMGDGNDGEETKEAQSTLTLLDGKAWGHSISDSLHLPLCKEEVSPEWQERNPSLVTVQEEQELLQIKDEQGGLLQRPNEADGSLTAVNIDDGDANGETGPLSSTLTERTETQAGVEDLPAHRYEFHTANGDEWEETSNALKPQKSHNAQRRVEGQTLSSSDKLSQNLEWSKLTLSARSHAGGANGHERTTNAGGTPFSCKVCQKHFSLSCHLKRHMESHTGSKPFSCTVCGKDFAQKNNLTRHIITHTYLPYSCAVCCKSYGLKSQLKTHMQTHSAKPVKPFICAFCGKCFGQSYALKRHTMIHTGEKPFSCPVCGKCFGLKHDLKRHMGIHRRETF